MSSLVTGCRAPRVRRGREAREGLKQWYNYQNRQDIGRPKRKRSPRGIETKAVGMRKKDGIRPKRKRSPRGIETLLKFLKQFARTTVRRGREAREGLKLFVPGASSIGFNCPKRKRSPRGIETRDMQGNTCKY